MEEKPRIGERVASLLTERIGTLVLVVVIILIGVSIAGYVFNWEWTGLRGTKDDGPKTLWHWLDLLIIPIVLAAGALWFKKVDEDARLAREQAEKDTATLIEEQRAQEAALETYFDRMSELLLDKDTPLLESEPGSVCQDMASTRTLTVLRRLDEKRRNQVFQFLRDARLLGVKKSRGDREEADPQETAADDGDPIAVFVGRNMSHINLSGAYLYGANLSGAYLYGANLSRALLYGANLSEAYLYEAMLREANLSGANMYGANLYGANLIGAYMHGANLSRANLMKANLSEANLSGTNLSNVKLLTCEQLRQAMQWEHAYRDEELACGASIPAAPKKKADV